MCASTEASTIAMSTSLRTTSSTVVTSSALDVTHASPGSRYTWTPNRSAQRPQQLAEPVHRVPRRRERDAPTQAHPRHRLEHLAVTVTDVADGTGEAVEVLVLTVEVEHQAAQPGRGRPQVVDINDAQSRVAPCRVGKVERRMADSRVDPQPELRTIDVVGEAVELGQRVEDHLVGERADRRDLLGGERHAVGVHLPAELLAAEASLVQRTTGRPVEVRPHQTEDAPGREALERQHRLRPRLVANSPDDLEVAHQSTLVDQVVRGSEQADRPQDGALGSTRRGGPAR